VVIFFTK
jgi:hypothetical protein